MADIDEVKEILNTLRIALSIAFGVLVVLIGGIVKSSDTMPGRLMSYSGLGWGGALAILVLIVLIVVKLSKKTKEIKDL